MRIYLAAPLFSQTQRTWNRAIKAGIEEALTEVEVILPQDFRAAGRFNDTRHYGALFRKCQAEISRCDCVLAILDGADVDSGSAFQMGSAFALNIPIIGVRTDFRPGAEHGVNIMCARACRYIVREFAFQEDPAAVVRGVVRRLQKIRKAQS